MSDQVKKLGNGADVKIILKRSPMSPENGVWIDGIKLDGVQDVTVYGGVRQVPQVVITFIPKTIELGVENPDLDKVTDE